MRIVYAAKGEIIYRGNDGGTPMKTTVSLNGTWKFAPTHDQKPNNNRNMIDADTPLYAYPSLNRRDWESVPVPGVWERYAEKYSIYEGV